MKLWKKPRLAAALCAVVVLVCAAAPAVFLSVVDAASLGHSQAVADPYTAPTPTADDYYLLRQLSARQLTQSKYTFQPGDTGQERKPLIYYNNQANDLTDMTNGWDYVDTVNTALQSLADAGAISQACNDMELTRKLVQDLVIEKTDKDNKKVEIPLKDIAAFEDTISPKSVSRTEQNRYIAVSASIADGYNVGLVSRKLEQNLADYEVPEGYSLVMEGENEMIVDAMQQLMLMLLLAVIFMYLIMVAQFQSLKSPFIIMFTIPLAFTGGFLGLFLGNCEVSVVAVIGFVMLAGIIVNNGIVIVDYMNQLIAQGMEKHEAILQAGRTRLRPVLMTALTTILGLLPMVFGTDMGAAMGKPMAIVTVGGLLYGTLLTLLVVPCIYDLMNCRKTKGLQSR